MVRTIYRVFKRSINKQNLNNENNVKISITFGSLFHIHILVCRFVLFSFFVLLLHINTFDYFFFSAFWYQKFICMIIGFPYLSIEGNLCWTLFQKMKYFKTRAFGSVYSIPTSEKKNNYIIWYKNVSEQGNFNAILREHKLFLFSWL